MPEPAPSRLSRYRKSLVAASGAAVIVLSQLAGLAVDSEDAEAVVDVFDSVVAALTAFGVYRVPNSE